MSFIQQFFTSRDNNANAETFVGQEGRLWWDPITNKIYYSDGSTPGGIAVTSGGGSQGTTGAQGATGTQGLGGLQGTTGAGTQGATGAQGVSGSQGTSGSQGATGAGTQGTTGIQGASGATGAGTQGTTGAQGTTGTGTQGTTGAQGPAGAQGTTGAQGTLGAQGTDGAQGVSGSQGTTGAQGTTGTFTGNLTANINGQGYNISNVSSVTATGNITGNYYIGNGSLLTSLTGANVTGTVSSATAAFNLNGGTAGALVAQNGAGATGFITIAAANTILVSSGSAPAWTAPDSVAVGTVTANAQPNITSVGTLTSVTVTGNVQGGNLRTGGLISATGNILGGNVTTTGAVYSNYNTNTANTGSFMATGGNTKGGTGYLDFLVAQNTSGGATNPYKWMRTTSDGQLQIINSAYTTNIFNLTDAGAFSVPGPISISGKQAVNGPAFSAYANASLQTITSGSQQKVLFQTEEFDTNNNFASSRFTPTVEGYYQLNAEVRLDGVSGTGEMMIVIWKNGSGYKRGTNQSGTQIASNFWAMQVSSVVYANGTTDYFEIYVQQGSGGSVTVTAVNDPAITWFNGCMLRGA